MTTGRPLTEAPGLSSAGPLAWVAYELEGECYAPVPRVSTITLRLEARKRIAAARFHLAEGFRVLDDASRRFSHPFASVSLPAVTPRVAGKPAPEAVCAVSGGLSVRPVHTGNSSTEHAP